MTNETERAKYKREYVRHAIETGVDEEDATIAVDIAFHAVSQIDEKLREASQQLGDPVRVCLMLTVAGNMLQHLSEHALGMAEQIADKEATHATVGQDAVLRMMLLAHGIALDETQGVVLYGGDDETCDCPSCNMARELGDHPQTQRVDIGSEVTAFIAPREVCLALHAKHMTGETVQ